MPSRAEMDPEWTTTKEAPMSDAVAGKPPDDEGSLVAVCPNGHRGQHETRGVDSPSNPSASHFVIVRLGRVVQERSAALRSSRCCPPPSINA
jgi:hypothetical protein